MKSEKSRMYVDFTTISWRLETIFERFLVQEYQTQVQNEDNNEESMLRVN